MRDVTPRPRVAMIRFHEADATHRHVSVATEEVFRCGRPFWLARSSCWAARRFASAQLPPPILPTPPPSLITVPVPLTITGNRAYGTVGLPGINLELTITFESVVGLTSGALEASVSVVTPPISRCSAGCPDC